MDCGELPNPIGVSMATRNPILALLDEWLKSCAKNGNPSRNTVAVGIVVLDQLRRNCPIEEAQTRSEGGEIRGSRATLPKTLEIYGIENYLKEVTTRAGHQQGQRLFERLEYGRILSALAPEVRDGYLLEAIDVLIEHAKAWLNRQQLRFNCDRQLAPKTWIRNILEEAKGRSGGKVEQHLVGAKLERRHPKLKIANNPGHAGDAQTGRSGDFLVGKTVYHVTTSPSLAVIEKCEANLRSNLHPVLLVPCAEKLRATHLAELKGIYERVTIAGIEDFIALNIIEMSDGDHVQFAEELTAILRAYNRRFDEVETDLSLKINLDQTDDQTD
jgi:hypothetical protein